VNEIKIQYDHSVGKGSSMSMTGLEVFDSTVQKTNLWIKEVMEALGWEDRHKAYEGLKVTL